MILVIGVMIAAAAIGLFTGLLFLRWLLPPDAPPEVELPRVSPVILTNVRSAVENLIFEIKSGAGRTARAACDPSDGVTQLADDRQMALLAMRERRITIAPSMQSLAAAVEAFERSGIFEDTPQGRSVIPEYWPVASAYNNLLTKPWLVVAQRYRDGEPLTGNELQNFCAHGLTPLADDFPLEQLKATLNRAEDAASAPTRRALPRSADLAELHRRLERAGVPLTGLNEQHAATPESDIGLTAYFPHGESRVWRITLARELSHDERGEVQRVIRRFESDEWWRALVTR